MAHIKLANSIEFKSLEGRTILESGRMQGVVLEHSCRTGQCGVCRVRVNNGETKISLPEQCLTEQDLDDGFILTCCRSAVANVELDTVDLGRLAAVRVQTLPARLDSLTRLADDVLEIVLRVPPASKFYFLAGQYIDVIGPGGVRRSYSVANAPRDDGKLVLHISRVDGGALSRYWFGEAKANDLLRLEGPLGTFCIRDTEASRLILLATGTGIAPVKAILEELEQDPSGCGFDQITVYWGGRYLQDIYWTPVFKSLPLTFEPVLSRESDFAGRRGYVQSAVLEDAWELSDAVVYACGSDAMIHDARSALIKAGLPEKQFYSDAFLQSGGARA